MNPKENLFKVIKWLRDKVIEGLKPPEGGFIVISNSSKNLLKMPAAYANFEVMFSEIKKKFSLVILFLTVGFFVLPIKAADTGIIINEIMYDLEGADDNHEWVEIYNNSEQDIDITAWKFNDGSNHLLNIPPQNGGQGSMIIPGGGFAILADSASTFLADHPGFSGTVIDTVMSLGQQKDKIYTLRILNKEGAVVDEISYSVNLGANGNGRTLERKRNGDLAESLEKGGTPGRQNSVFPSGGPTPLPTPISTLTPTPTLLPTSTPIPTLLSTFTPSPILTPTSSPILLPAPTAEIVVGYSRSVVINEFLPDPIGNDSEGEWIELFNDGDEPVDLGGWKLTNKTSKFTIPQNTIIGAKAFLVFYRSITKLSINNNGEILSLFDPEGELAFKVSYENKALEGQTWARQPNGRWAWSSVATPGSHNIFKTAKTSLSSSKKTSSLVKKETVSLPLENGQVVGQNLAALNSSTQNYKVIGSAVLLGLFSVASILILKRFL